MAELWLWRHPKPINAAGRCIGQTDLAVDPRRAKRLAHHIRAVARRERLPREIWTSPLRRCADVARWLKRWGWRHHVDARLLELDFGAWDGRRWSEIDPAEVAAWTADFLHHAPGGGESLQQLRVRLHNYLGGPSAGSTGSAVDDAAVPPRLIVAHAGWINALVVSHITPLSASDWPAAPAYGQGFRVSCTAAAATMRSLSLRPELSPPV